MHRRIVHRFMCRTMNKHRTARPLRLDGDKINSLRDMLDEHNSWVQTYKSAVDEIVRNDHNIHDAQICFGPENRATHRQADFGGTAIVL